MAVARLHGDAATGVERVYVVQDANFNVTSIIGKNETDWEVIERYIFDPYGERTVLNADWTVDTDGLSDFNFVHGHQGGRHDLAVGLVDFRNRFLDTSLGRWTRQDPLGYVDGMSLYNSYRNAPVRFLDPAGLKLEQVVGGIWEVGPYDAWSGAYGNLASKAHEFADEMVREHGKGCSDLEKSNIREAARHAYWQAMLTQKHGHASAATIGDLHEGNNNSFDSRRDRANNRVGRDIGGRGYDDVNTRKVIENALISGKLSGITDGTVGNFFPCDGDDDPCNQDSSSSEDSSGSEDSSSGESTSQDSSSAQSNRYFYGMWWDIFGF
jgi:RHS repeat-associated protein